MSNAGRIPKDIEDAVLKRDHLVSIVAVSLVLNELRRNHGSIS